MVSIRLAVIYLIIFLSLQSIYISILYSFYKHFGSGVNAVVFAFQSIHSLCISLFLLFISWMITNKLYFFIRRAKISAKNRIVLITGCDSGFGLQLAIRCHQIGFHVFAGVLNADSEGADRLASTRSERLRVIKLDVTNADEIAETVRQIRNSDLQLWAVVNNAGALDAYPFCMGADDCSDVVKLFSVNLFGATRLTKLCLPLLIRSRGRIVNVASIAGRITFPIFTTYCVTKHAMRAFSDGLRRELNRFGIKVVTIEPYYYRTPIVNSVSVGNSLQRAWTQSSDEFRELYGENEFNNLVKAFEVANTLTNPNIHQVVEAMVDAIQLEEPQLYYRCSNFWRSVWLWFFRNAPEYLQDYPFDAGFTNM